MRFDVITLFPDMVRSSASYGVVGRAIENGIVDLVCWNPRDYAKDKYRTVDDRPYGGGPGMVMMVQPLRDTLATVKKVSDCETTTVCLSPQGKTLTQDYIRRLVKRKRLILIAGRYEGIDERFIESEVDEELSLGDYVLTGGELATLVVIDGLTRLLPGVLGDESSAQFDSFMTGLLDYPHYTRPKEIDGREVPEVLRNGNHSEIARWRMKQALGRTAVRRPDLLSNYPLTHEQQQLLKEFEIETRKFKENQ